MSELPENRLIYRLKRSDSESVTRFLAQELAPGIRRHMDEKHAYVLVGCPRSKSAIRKYGYDHVQLMGKTLSGELGIPYIDAVEHIGHAGAQKTKNRKERLQAAVLSYRPNKKKSLKGKTVILLDDVVTTGATLAACARATRKLGARGILCAVIGSNFRYSDLAERKVYETERKRLQFPYRLKR
jgi:ComF family protein